MDSHNWLSDQADVVGLVVLLVIVALVLMYIIDKWRER